MKMKYTRKQYNEDLGAYMKTTSRVLALNSKTPFKSPYITFKDKTDSRTALLETLKAILKFKLDNRDEAPTASQIARILGCGRSAAISKMKILARKDYITRWYSANRRERTLEITPLGYEFLNEESITHE